MQKIQLAAVLNAASADVRFHGWLENCAAAAIAINEELFDKRGGYVAVWNKALYAKGMFVGHIAVRYEGQIWDADGIPRTLDCIAEWGRLEASDSIYAELFSDSAPWDHEKAWDVEVCEFSTREKGAMVFDQFSMLHLDDNRAAVRDALSR